MAVLWLKFAGDVSLPASFTEMERRKLEEIYDAARAGSVWSRALGLLGMPRRTGDLIRWHKGMPYINWNLMVYSITAGTAEAVKADDGGYTFKANHSFARVLSLIRCQWKTARYVQARLAADLPQERDAQLVESTALGLALQALMLRLPRHEPRDFAMWLAAPLQSPPRIRGTMLQISAIQKRRTKLSSAWTEIFPPREGEEPEAPGHFWDEPAEDAAAPASLTLPPKPQAVRPRGEGGMWGGLPVCGGQVSGRAIIVKSVKNFTRPDMSEFSVLVFPRAKPETTEVFPFAAALLFGEGGALSHACTVAREQGIPCITGLGPDFISAIESGKNLWLSVDGAMGTVTVVPAMGGKAK